VVAVAAATAKTEPGGALGVATALRDGHFAKSQSPSDVDEVFTSHPSVAEANQSEQKGDSQHLTP